VNGSPTPSPIVANVILPAKRGGVRVASRLLRGRIDGNPNPSAGEWPSIRRLSLYRGGCRGGAFSGRSVMGRVKGKITKKLTSETPEVMVKLSKQTSPKFAHNAGAANKGVTWTYEFWLTTDTKNRGTFDLDMDIDKMKNLNENKQSERMNDDAKEFLEEKYPDYKVKLTSV
jgi:hypothetical protein